MTSFLICISFFVFIRAGHSYSIHGHVVGGELTVIKKFPHSVYLQMLCEPNNSWMCGASILNQMMVLTAAHCFEKVSKKCQIDAMAGHEALDMARYVRRVRNFTLHENYAKKHIRNDIAIGHLMKKFPLGGLVQRVMITDYFTVGGKLSVAGWGAINDVTQELSMVLKSVEQYLLPDCRILGNIDVGMFCASNSIMDRPSKGDSGSALVMKHGHQVGLVSFRTKKFPEVIVYTNTSYYYQWIGDTARKLHCPQDRCLIDSKTQ